MQTQKTHKQTGKSSGPSSSGLLQRKCICGNHTIAGEECDECSKTRHSTQAPEPATAGSFGEPRFGHDFSMISAHPAAPRLAQSRLKINPPDDKYEQEANRVVDKVVKMPDPGKNIQKRCDDCEKQDAGPMPMVSKVSPSIQRRVLRADIDQEKIRRAMERLGIPAGMPSQTLSFIDALRGAGQPLPESLRRFFEPRFGVDLGAVRLHTGGAATRLAGLLNAKAFTMGQDIVFGAGEYSPDTDEGKNLLAHELVHTIQQDGNSKPSVINDVEEVATRVGESLTDSDASPKASPKAATDTAEAAPQSAEGETEAAPSGQSATIKAPANPEEDPEYQAVVMQSNINAGRMKIPIKNPGTKKGETKSAANLKPEDADSQKSYGKHLNAMADAQSKLTVDEFVESFKKAADELAKKLPENKEAQGVGAAARLTAQRVITKQELADQNKTRSNPLRVEAGKKATDYPPAEKSPEAPELKPDPPGNIPKITHAESAAPKPKTDDEISLDKHSRDLDDTLRNHDVNGQTINIDEASLAFPKSGEKSFDEAGELKRKAQDEIAKSRPRYRDAEGGIIGGSKAEIRSLVDTGLQGHYLSRSGSFKTVLDNQKSHAGGIVDRKKLALGKSANAYEETKKDVNKELEKLNAIEETFDQIVKDAQTYFDTNVRQQLEYIYTPGMFDYSDWIDLHKAEIKKELESPSYEGEHAMVAYAEARKAVQDRDAEKYFGQAKSMFIFNVTWGVKEKIAPVVVGALNAVRERIRKGKEEGEKAFSDLTPQELKDLETVRVAVTDQFKTLEESVTDRQREIVSDMARTYNRNVDKLRAQFNTIKKDVLTSWFEKAWNKLKAIVNAIIDFATRIAELLGRVAYLIGDIVSSPRYFFNNLVNGIGKGLSTFVGRIDEFLATAFFDWLRGSSGIPIQLPKNWGPQGIFSLFTQLLGLSTETIWGRMEVVYNKTIANAFRRGEVLLEKGLEIFGIIKNEGLGGLWGQIKDSLGTILDDTLDNIKETVLYAAIKKVIIEIGKLLVPGGGFIAIAEKVIRLLQFIVEARNKILDLIEAFVSSLEEAVKGNIPGIVNLITGALTKFITVALDFLISFFGLSSLKDKVERFIERMNKPIIRGIDWVLNKLKSLVLRVFGRKGEERQREESPARKQLELEETKEPVSPDKPGKAQADVGVAKQIVRRALDTHLPSGARQLADVNKVLAGIAAEVKPALTDLRAEEFMPGKPKEEGAIGFKVMAKLQTGKDSIIDSVRFSKEGKVLDHEERWQLGVKGVKRGLLQLEKRGISEATIKEQFPKWQAEFGFTLLDLNMSEIPWAIEGEMSQRRLVVIVPSIPRMRVTYEHVGSSPKHPGEPSIKSKKLIVNPLTAEQLGRGTRPSVVIAGWYRAQLMNRQFDTWVRMHLLSEKLGGPGDNPRNLAVGNDGANGKMRTIEHKTLDILEDPTKPRALVYEAEVKYRSKKDADFPESVSLNAWKYDRTKEENKGAHLAGNDNIDVLAPVSSTTLVNLLKDEKETLKVDGGFSDGLASAIDEVRQKEGPFSQPEKLITAFYEWAGDNHTELTDELREKYLKFVGS